MQQPVRYIHIGFPKCASTALQKSFFSKHPDLYHLGASSGGTAAAYINNDVQTAIDVSLRFEREAAYDEAATRRVFDRQFEIAAVSGKRATGISSESFSLMLNQDIDTVQKAKRLHKIFGAGTKIVFIIREQWSFIRSIYRELVLCGLHLPFNTFVEHLYCNQARNFLMDLNYYNTYAMYCGLFGKEHVLLLPYESLKKEPANLLTQIQKHLEITPLITTLAQANRRADDAHVETVRRLNCVFRVNCGRSPFEPFMAFRFPAYFEDKLDVAIPQSVIEDEQFIHSISSKRDKNLLPYPVAPVSYDVPSRIYDKINLLFTAWNQTLMEQTQIDLSAVFHADPTCNLQPATSSQN